eukprot:1169759-Amphidinium_carterae.1
MQLAKEAVVSRFAQQCGDALLVYKAGGGVFPDDDIVVVVLLQNACQLICHHSLCEDATSSWTQRCETEYNFGHGLVDHTHGPISNLCHSLTEANLDDKLLAVDVFELLAAQGNAHSVILRCALIAHQMQFDCWLAAHHGHCTVGVTNLLQNLWQEVPVHESHPWGSRHLMRCFDRDIPLPTKPWQSSSRGM